MPNASAHVFAETDLNTTLEKCGNIIEMAPPVATIQLLLLSQSLPILLFGGLFALPALRQLHNSAKDKLRSIRASNVSAASSASG